VSEHKVISIRSRILQRAQQKAMIRYEAADRGYRDTFYSRVFAAIDDALDAIDGHREEFSKVPVEGGDLAAEALALGFILFRLRTIGVDPQPVFSALLAQLESGAPGGEAIVNEIVRTNSYLAAHGLPKRATLAQIVAEQGIPNRARWLKEWRARMGITQYEAAHVLGYTDRRQIGKIEAGFSQPSWNKVFRAIEAERLTRQGESLEHQEP